MELRVSEIYGMRTTRPVFSVRGEVPRDEVPREGMALHVGQLSAPIVAVEAGRRTDDEGAKYLLTIRCRDESEQQAWHAAVIAAGLRVQIGAPAV
jgi:hypothetical protein